MSKNCPENSGQDHESVCKEKHRTSGCRDRLYQIQDLVKGQTPGTFLKFLSPIFENCHQLCLRCE